MSLQIYYQLLWIWIFLAFIVFLVSLFITAPYGRHVKTGWGPFYDNKIGWLIYESPALLLFPILFISGNADKTISVWIMFSCFMLHYVNRTLIFPFRIRTKGKKMPLGIIVSAFVFNTINAGILGYYLGHLQSYDSGWLSDPRFIVGMLLFFVGLGINWASDHKLIHLRGPNETGYKIPHGGLFNYVSCPNHLGEIIEWSGYAIMLWALPGTSFAIWTVANLIPRTLDHHKWYRITFEKYPDNRKAVIPFVL